MENIENMLRDIAAGQVVLFEKLSKLEDKQNNRTRSGVDYKKEFSTLINQVKHIRRENNDEPAY